MSQRLSSKTDVDYSWESHDKLVKKTVIEGGKWDERGAPEEGGLARIVISKIEGELDDSAYLSDGEKEIIIGEADTATDRLIERCSKMMFKGELSLVKLYSGRIKFNMLLKDCVNIAPIFDWTLEERLKRANHHKEIGAGLCGKERFSDAFHRYKRAFQIVILSDTKDNSDVYELYKALCNNLALCQLHMDNYEHAITLCNKVLGKDTENVKCLLRRAKGFNGIKEYVQAYKDINRVLELEPHNKTALEMLSSAKKDIADQQVKDMDLCKKMLNFA